MAEQHEPEGVRLPEEEEEHGPVSTTHDQHQQSPPPQMTPLTPVALMNPRIIRQSVNHHQRMTNRKGTKEVQSMQRKIKKVQRDMKHPVKWANTRKNKRLL